MCTLASHRSISFQPPDNVQPISPSLSLNRLNLRIVKKSCLVRTHRHLILKGPKIFDTVWRQGEGGTTGQCKILGLQKVRGRWILPTTVELFCWEPVRQGPYPEIRQMRGWICIFKWPFSAGLSHSPNMASLHHGTFRSRRPINAAWYFCTLLTPIIAF